VRIGPRAWISAYILQRFSPFFWRPPKELYFASRPVAKPVEVRVRTRHGAVRCLIYRPPAGAPAPGGAGRPPPVHLQIHGGGFYGRFPTQDEHIAMYLASDAGAVVVAVDYDVAPQVRFPVAEDECFDVAAWIHATGAVNGWDPARFSVGGFSAGGKLALNVCQMAHASGAFRLCALVTAFAVADVARADRSSAKRNAKISPALQNLVRATYFAGVRDRFGPIASPLYDADLARAMPPALIMTGEYDTLAPEMDRIAERLAAASVPVVHRRFAKTDHGFTHEPPVATAREAIELIGRHLLSVYSAPE